MVSSLSIIFMGISGLMTVAIPIGLYIFLRRRFDMSLASLLTGAGAFIVFTVIMEQLLHTLVLRPDAEGNIALITKNPSLYVIYIIFAAAVFAETARYVSLSLLSRRYKGIGPALSYGIGHGSFEAIFLLGMASLNNILISLLINSATPEMLEEAGITADMIAAYINIHPGLFLAAGIERIFTIAIHISLSVLIMCAVTNKSYIWLYPAAVLLHAAANLPAALSRIGAIPDIFITLALCGIAALSVAVLTLIIYRRLNSSAELLKKITQQQ